MKTKKEILKGYERFTPDQYLDGALMYDILEVLIDIRDIKQKNLIYKEYV